MKVHMASPALLANILGVAKVRHANTAKPGPRTQSDCSLPSATLTTQPTTTGSIPFP